MGSSGPPVEVLVLILVAVQPPWLGSGLRLAAALSKFIVTISVVEEVHGPPLPVINSNPITRFRCSVKPQHLLHYDPQPQIHQRNSYFLPGIDFHFPENRKKSFL